MADTSRPEPLKGALAGLLGGLAASLAMDGFQALIAKLSPDDGSDGEPATEQAADRASEAATGAPVPEAKKGAAGQAVHYLTGAGLGIAYGIAAEYRPSVTAGFGTAFAGSTATVLDEGAVPALGLGSPPWRTPASGHAYSYASHVVFGVVTEAVRRLVRG